MTITAASRTWRLIGDRPADDSGDHLLAPRRGAPAGGIAIAPGASPAAFRCRGGIVIAPGASLSPPVPFGAGGEHRHRALTHRRPRCTLRRLAGGVRRRGKPCQRPLEARFRVDQELSRYNDALALLEPLPDLNEVAAFASRPRLATGVNLPSPAAMITTLRVPGTDPRLRQVSAHRRLAARTAERNRCEHVRASACRPDWLIRFWRGRCGVYHRHSSSGRIALIAPLNTWSGSPAARASTGSPTRAPIRPAPRGMSAVDPDRAETGKLEERHAGSDLRHAVAHADLPHDARYRRGDRYAWQGSGLRSRSTRAISLAKWHAELAQPLTAPHPRAAGRRVVRWPSTPATLLRRRANPERRGRAGAGRRLRQVVLGAHIQQLLRHSPGCVPEQP